MVDSGWQIEQYRKMLRIRLIEEEIANRYSEQEMRCPVHLSIGQEAAAVGACSALTQKDQIVTSHRNHGHYLAKGGDLDSMMAEIYGRESGCCGGRGGSMHLFDNAAGVLASIPIVGSSIPLAVGVGLAFKQDNKENVGVAFFGDAAIEEGVFHESANLAAVLELPVIFFIENNLYSIYTPLSDRQPNRPMEDIARAYGMPAYTEDGNDVQVVHNVMTKAVNRAREGGGPSMIFVNTYRWREHCGPNYDNDLGYRTQEEFASWVDRCPVETYAVKLREENLLDPVIEQDLRDTIAREIETAFELARNAPFPKPETAGNHVYA